MEKYQGTVERLVELKTTTYDDRVHHLIKEITALNLPKSKKALRLVMETMNKEHGFTRHDDRDYFVHPIAITQTALDFNIVSDFIKNNQIEKADRLLCVCLLHDVIEDIDTIDKEYIVTEFGIDIARDVDNVTKRDGELFVDYMERFISSEVSALVKILDRLNNVSTLANSSYNHRVRQVKETKEFYIPLTKVLRRMYWEHSKFLFQVRTIMNSILAEVEREIETYEREQKLIEKIKQLEKNSKEKE